MTLPWWLSRGRDWSNRQLVGWWVGAVLVLTPVLYLIHSSRSDHVHPIEILAEGLLVPTFGAAWQWFLRECERERRAKGIR
jgi:hypothetical protein